MPLNTEGKARRPLNIDHLGGAIRRTAIHNNPWGGIFDALAV